jgi:hypothetical protein
MQRIWDVQVYAGHPQPHKAQPFLNRSERAEPSAKEHPGQHDCRGKDKKWNGVDVDEAVQSGYRKTDNGDL